MKSYATLILLTILCPWGYSLRAFDIQTIKPPSEFSNGLKLQSELNKEIQQGLLRIGQDMDAQINPKPHLYYEGNKKYAELPKFGGDIESQQAHLISQPHSQSQCFLEESEYNGNIDSNKNYVEETLDDFDTNSDENEDDGNDSTESELKTQRYVQTSLEGTQIGIPNFVGTNLFDGTRRYCFSSEDVALLAARKDFERLIPKDFPHGFLNDKAVNLLLHYFYGGSQIIQRMADNITKHYIEKAFYDTLGGYLQFFMLPVAKYSFYAGELSLKTATNVFALYEQCKAFLNTNGNGWKSPAGAFSELKNFHLKPLHISSCPKKDYDASYCARLDLSVVNDEIDEEQMIVALPKLEAKDSDGFLGNIWLPFKQKKTYNLRSSKSEFIVVKFYQAVAHCYHFQSISLEAYNRKFKTWILENVQAHLTDDQFYPGLGAILMVFGNLKRNKKAASYNDPKNINDDFDMKSLEESIKQKKDVNATEKFVSQEEELEEPNWFTKTFGKRDNDTKSDYFNDNDDDDIDLDVNDDFEFEDYCPTKKTENEEKEQIKNLTKIYVQNNQPQLENIAQEKDKTGVVDKGLDSVNVVYTTKNKGKYKVPNRGKSKLLGKKADKLKDKQKEIYWYDADSSSGRGKSLRRMLLEHWICWLSLIILIILLILLCCLMALWKKRRPNEKVKLCMIDEKLETEPEPKPQPICYKETAPKKRRGFFRCFGSNQSEEDEGSLIQIPCPEKKQMQNCEDESEMSDDNDYADEVLIKPESSSVLVAPFAVRRSTTSQSVRKRESGGQELSPNRGQNNNIRKLNEKSNTPVLATSIKRSSSECQSKSKETLLAKKIQSQGVTLNEKRNSKNDEKQMPAATSKRKTKDKFQTNDDPQQTADLGVQRKISKLCDDNQTPEETDKINSTSWETMYDS